jgi:hypothetical protein
MLWFSSPALEDGIDRRLGLARRAAAVLPLAQRYFLF